MPDQSTLINIAIGKEFDAVLWRNHPGADPDTQYVWWHCDNSPAAGSDPNGAAACDNPVNFGGFNDPVINTALDKARVGADAARRGRKLYEDLNKRVRQAALEPVVAVHAVDGRVQAQRPRRPRPEPPGDGTPGPFEGLADRPPGRRAVVRQREVLTIGV